MLNHMEVLGLKCSRPNYSYHEETCITVVMKPHGCACRPKTSPAAADAEERRLSGHLRVVQSLSGSPPEKPAMKRRLSLGAPQRWVGIFLPCLSHTPS